MKPRVAALLLTALMLLLVGMIPAVGAQSAGPEHPVRPDKALPAPATSRQTVDIPAPPVTNDQGVDAIRLERHPNENEALDRPHAGSELAAPAEEAEAPVMPEQAGPPAGYPYPPPAPEPETAVVRASVDELGQDGNSYSYDPDITPGGRFVAFTSTADNLVPGDWNEVIDIFVRDLQANTIERVSVSSGGVEGNGESYGPSISANGRYVVFYSYADNLVNNDENGSWSDVFLHDRQTGETSIISRHSDGTQGINDSYDPVISDDGQLVAYSSHADNLVDVDENGSSSDIFIHDLSTGDTTLVSRHSDGTQGNWSSYQPALSADGQLVAFYSYADNLVDVDENGTTSDIFVHDPSTGDTTLVSRHSNGTQGNWESYAPALSADGQLVAFQSTADNLVDDDFNGWPDVFIHDSSTGDTTLISRHSDGTPGNWESYSPSVSGDGQFVAFLSYSDNLIDSDANGTASDIFLHDVQNGLTTLVSKSVYGEQGNWYSYEPSVSADGSIVAFESNATNLVPFNWNGYTSDIYVRLTDQANLHTISGRVTDEFGNGLGGKVVRDISGAAVYTDGDGYYTIDPLLPGNHGVWAWDEYYFYLFPSSPILVTLPPNATDVDIEGISNAYNTYWYTPVADAYVDQANKAANYGTKPYLRVRNAAADLTTYLKFNVNDLPACAYISGSSLSLFARDPGPDGGWVSEVEYDNWTETGIKWNNAPALGYELGGFFTLFDEEYNWAWVGNVWRNDIYSYAVRNYSADMVQYDSREAANTPWLVVDWLQKPTLQPDAWFGSDRWSGLGPLAVQFTDNSTGCPTSWHWDFGDGATSTAQNPSHTFTNPGYYAVTLTVTNSEGIDKKTYWIEVIEPPSMFYISPSAAATIGGYAAQPADILLYDKPSNHWTMVYDGSDHLTTKNVTAFAFNDGDLLLVFAANQVIAGLGTATPFDVVRFTPDDPWTYPLGSGTFSWAFQGKPKGLTTSGEKIDAFDTVNTNEFIFSTTGAAAIPTAPILKAADEDLFYWLDWAWEWGSSLSLDGSNITGLAAEDINGYWYDSQTNDHYVTILGAFNLGGVTGNSKNIVRLSWNGNGYTPSIVPWLAPGANFPTNIDAIELAR